MAPVTRSSLHGRSMSREGSWQIPTDEDLPPEQAADADADSDADEMEEAADVENVPDQATEEDQSDQSFDEDPFPGMLTGLLTQILQPLQQTADRVSRQVEDFARRLDRFHSSRDRTRAELWKDALDLAGAYGNIAKARKSHTSFDLLQARHPTRSRQGQQALAEEGQLEVQRAQNEVDLWELFTLLTSFQDPDMQAAYAKAQKTCLRSLHRYSSDSEIWQTFLTADQHAEEYQEILGWLHRTASASRLSIDDVTESLRRKADRGDGIWCAGWLFTKESIKTQKRNRSWPKPLDHDNPGLESSHVRKSDSQPLVAQLDPDAQFREAAALEESDECHEQAAWLACWEMLRRGASAETVREWWLERKECWRAISTSGGTPADLNAGEREWSRFTGLWATSEWAASCYRLCHSDTAGSRHEAAVYGLLCGDTQVPVQVCQTMDDYLFVHLNAFLIERYRDFGNAMSQKESRQTYQPGPAKYDEIRRLVQYCQHNEKTIQESQGPFKNIQSMIISKDLESFFLRQGRALAQIANMEDHPSYLIVSDGIREVNEAAQITASDPDGLRIIAHQQLILKALGFLDELYAQHEGVMENNLTAYIGWLQQEGKMALIPLYASTLSPSRGARVLGAVIMDVTDMKERDLMTNLMKKYKLDISNVLFMQYQLNVAASGLQSRENPRTIKAVNITKYVGSGKAKNLKINPDPLGGEVSDAEELLIRCLEWYRYGDRSCWDQTCQVASTLYKHFISSGRLAAARALCSRAQLATISKAALGIDLKYTASSGNASEEEDVEIDGPAEEERAQPISPSKRRNLVTRQSASTDEDKPGLNLAVLAEQAQTWRQLEQLMETLGALDSWNAVADDVEKTKGDLTHMRSRKKILQAALDDVRNSMYPLLESDFLSRPSDEAEAISLTNLRNHYLPECVLAYNSVLYFAGHAISRTWLIECMNLAQVVAANETLTEAFVQSSRMKELVMAFAMSSQALLHANEHGGRRGKKDENLEVWQVRPVEVGLSDN